jgi:hypothetical protein
MESFLTGATAALLTLFDLDRTFYVPSRAQRKAVLYAWWWGFVLINSAFAILLYEIVGSTDSLKNLHPLLRAISVGAAYLALIRLKFTTFSFQGKEIPFGLEFFYEGLKGFVFKRINKIAKQARFTETVDLAAKTTLAELTRAAKLGIEQDQLLSTDEKRTRKAWVVGVLQDANTPEDDKKLTLANYVLSDQRSSDTS